MKEFKIGKFTIGLNHPPFVIAEMSGNHNQSLERALGIVDAVAATGAHALKLQTYTPDTLTINSDLPDFQISDDNSLWKGKNLYQLYQEAYTPWEWHQPIFERAKQLGLLVFSTPFDDSAVDFLEELDVPAYKIASFENCDWQLLRKVAETGKPVIMSTGITNLSDLDESVNVLKAAGCTNLILLKCTSSYPSTPENTNLNTIPVLSQTFDCIAGLSDHTMGVGAAVASVALGGRVIEKHFCLSRAEGGVDSAFSLEPEEFKSLVIETERAFLSLGSVQFGIQESEKKSIKFKRSLYIVKDIKKGEIFTIENVRSIRPGLGIAPKYLNIVIGKTANIDIKEGTALSWNLFM